MALKVGSDGEIRLVLRVQDDGTAVIENFADVSSGALKKASGESAAAGKEMGKAGEQAESAGTAILGFGKKAFLAVGGVTAFSAAANAVVLGGLKMADNMDLAAQKLGVTTEWLSKVRYAAGLVDQDVQQLSLALNIMNRNIAEANVSGEGITKVLDSLRLSAADLQKAGPQHAFEAILSAIEKIPDPMERARVQMEIFGARSGKDVGLLAGALKQAGDDAERFGLIVSGQTGEAADQFYDDIYRLNQQLRGLGLTVAKEVAGPFSALMKLFADFLRDSGAIRSAADAIVIGLRGIGAVVVLIGTAFGLAGKALGGFLAIMDALRQGNLREALGIAKETGQELAEVIRKFSELEKLMLGLGGAGGEQKKGGMKKMAFFPGAANDGMFSDVLPGAELITAANDSEAQAMDEHYAAMIARRRSYLLELQQADEEAAKARQAVVDAALKGEANAMVTMFNYVAGLMQSKSRTLFQIGKTAAIAEAIVSTYQAVNNALALKPFWLGLAMSGVALAKGLANVQAIRAVQFGSQAAAPVFSANANTGLPAAPLAANDSTFVQTQTQTQAQPQFSRVEHYTLTGNFFDDAFMRDTMIPMIRRAQKDGVFLDFSFQQAA